MRTPTRYAIAILFSAASALIGPMLCAATPLPSHPSLYVTSSLFVSSDRSERTAVRRLVQVEDPGSDPSRLSARERLSRLRIDGGLSAAPAWDAQGSRRLVHVGVEALALYAYSRFRDGSDEFGFDRSALPAIARRQPLGDVSGGEAVASAPAGNAEGGAALAFESSASRTDPGIAWAGLASVVGSSSAGGKEIGELIHTPFGIVNRVAGQVLDVMSALRAAHLNQFPLRRDLSLKLDARTGRRSHFFAVITHRF